MQNFIRNLISLFKVLYTLSKYQILTDPGNIFVPSRIRFLGNIIALFSYPKSVFFHPTMPFGKRLASFCKDLGPIYIKFGQTLSTRPDLVGKEVAESLKYLQDKLPAFDAEIAIKIIETQFNRKIDEIFAKFNKKPIAAASIAQVHKAELLSGEKVAVKILRPDIAEKYHHDIKFLTFLANLASTFLPKTKRLKPNDIVKVFAGSMRYELDLKMEAAAASKLKDNFTGDSSLHIPNIYWQYTAENVLTIEWIDGVSIYNRSKILELGLDPIKVAANIAVIFFNMAYRDGFFHADLHPGNILVKKNGQIALLDFGIIGILPERDRIGIAEILYALLKRDYLKVAEVHRKIGYVPNKTDEVLFAQSIRSVAEPIIGMAIKDISIGNLLARLFKITEEFGMETQPQLLMLQKTIVVVEGIGQSLDHNINMWQLAEPWIKKWATKNLTPEAQILRLIKRFAQKIIDENFY